MEPFDLDLDSSNFTESRIFRAIKRQNHIKLLHAIHSGENVHLRDHEFNSTYLHVICSLAEATTEHKFLPMVYQLSNAGIDVNARDYKGRTALELALGRELQGIMAALLRCGTDPTERDYKGMLTDNGSPFEYELVNTVEKYEPGLWSAVSNGETGMVHMLINSWCRVNVSRDGVTLLQMARQTGKSEELINVLDDYEVTIEFVHATMAGDEKRMLEFLMDSKPCDPNIMDISYQERWSLPLEPRSLRDTAFCMEHTHILHLLPEDEATRTATTDSAGGEPRRPIRHIRDKGRTVTVMAITSLNGYVPGGDATSLFRNIISEDETSSAEGDSSVMQVMPDEQAQLQNYGWSHARSSMRARPNQYRLSEDNPKPQPQRTSQSKPSKQPQPHEQGQPQPATFDAAPHRPDTGGRHEAGSAQRRPREYYFHEVDSFVEQCYVDGAEPVFKTYVCRPNRTAEFSKENLKTMRKTDKRSIRSKMCVIS